jgi:hypothetical protein
MYWELWDVESRNLVEDFATEEEALQAIREILAVNRPDYVDFLALAAMYDEGESREAELPPALRGEELRARLAENASPPMVDDAVRAVHMRIRQWLAEEGWHVRDVNDPQASFNVMVTLHDGNNVNIFQYREQFDHIILSQHCVFDEQSRMEIARLPIAVQRKVVHHIRRDVSIMGADLTDLGVPSAEMRIRTRVYFDGLTKDTLIQRILLTIRALSLSLDTFVLALEESAYSMQAAPVNPVEEDHHSAEQATNEEPDHSSKLDGADPPIAQANDGEAGYSVEMKEADGPDELPSNVVRLRPRTEVPANDGDSRTVAS